MVSREQNRGNNLHEKLQLLRSITNSHAVILPLFFNLFIVSISAYTYSWIIFLYLSTFFPALYLTRDDYAFYMIHIYIYIQRFNQIKEKGNKN